MTDLATNLLKYLPVLLLAAPAMIWAYGAFKYARQWQFLIKPLSILGLVLAGLISLRALPSSTSDPWGPTRLAPIVSWVKGYPLLPPPGDGAVILRVYGPVSSMVYLPAAIAATPTTAILIAAFINFALFIVPGIWFIHRSTRGLRGEVVLAAVAIFLAIVLQHPVLLHSATMVTVDAPAIGLAACAIAALVGAANRTRAAWLAGLFAALSIWSKQTLTPVLATIVIYLFLSLPPKQALRQSSRVIGVVAGFSLLMLLLLGWGPLYFHLVTIPGNRNWRWPEPTTGAVMIRSLRTIWRDAIPVGWILAAAILIRRGWRVSANPSLLPLLTAILVLPLCTIAYALVGGESNHASPIIYFSLLASVTALAGACGTDAPGVVLARTPRIARLAMIGILTGALLIHPRKWSSLTADLAAWSNVRHNPNETAYGYARAHPGEVWFPKQPLASLLAEGKLYHFDEGLYFTQLAGVTVGPEWYASGLPGNLQAAAYRGDKPEGPMTPPPGFDQITTSPELPGWVLLVRSASPKLIETAPAR